MQLNVNEIFTSIQGEGRYVGTPAVFLRLQGCNLRCPWCDTKKSWDEKDGTLMDLMDVAVEIERAGPPLVVVTGGEPLLQFDALQELISMLPNNLFHLETNGTLPMFKRPSATPFCHTVVSPKPPAYFIHEDLCVREIKVVVDSEEAIAAAWDLGRKYFYATVSLQPVDNDPEWTKRCIAEMTRMVAQNYQPGLYFDESTRWRLSVQLHKLLGLK